MSNALYNNNVTTIERSVVHAILVLYIVQCETVVITQHRMKKVTRSGYWKEKAKVNTGNYWPHYYYATMLHACKDYNLE